MPDYKFDPRLGSTGRYRDANTGRTLPADDVRAVLDQTLANADDPVRELGAQLREGNVSLEDWRTQMREQIKSTHLSSAAAQKGGWDNMTQADFGRTGQVIRQEYGHLEDFTQEIATGRQRLDGTLQRRMRNYVEAGRETYNRFGRLAAADKGRDIMGSELTPADHCTECVEFDGHWYYIDTGLSVNGGPSRYKPPGTRICWKNCKCIEKYGTLDEAGNVAEASA